MKPVVTEEVVKKVQKALDPERAQWVDVTARVMNYDNETLVDITNHLLVRMTKYKGPDAHKLLDQAENDINVRTSLRETANNLKNQ